MTDTQTAPASRGPLTGVRILDLSSHIMGPHATQVMGDMGADVIMVEPLTGSKSRLMGQCAHPDMSPIGMNLMRGKRSLAIDLKQAEGREAVLELARSCDVVVTNLRAAPLLRLGLSYEQVAAINPGVVFCHAVGFAPESGRADEPAYDDIIQAECGLADAAQRLNGVPSLAPAILADKVCGMMVVNAVVSALFQREREGSGQGQYVRLAMLDVMRAFTLLEHGAGALAVPPLSAPGYTRVLSTARGPAQTADGWINMMPYSQREYDLLFAAGGRHDLVGSDKTAGRNVQTEADFLYRQLNEIIRQQSTQHWLDFCKQHGIAVGRIVSLDEIVETLPVREHPHAGRYRQIPPYLSFSRTPNAEPRPAPLVGEHSFELLREIGWDAQRLEELRSRGIVREASPAAMAAA